MKKRESILRSALRLLVNNGVHNTPMSAIAKEAGTGMGTIYNYFENKDELINELYLYIKEKEKTVFVPFDENRPVKTQFEDYYANFLDFFMQNPLYYGLIVQLQASPIITEKSREEGNRSVRPFMELLLHGQKNRIIKDIPAEELVMFIGGAVLSYLRWYFDQNEGQVSISNQLQLVWDAIKE
ncbi:TetR/AcrR family transcriptional regulator [Pseudozobellia thermophila]|uniref:TetR/AcrR family transcriptional regulator n=1 Tax=Pseudozobellia thermophila TaxID=192903 RepID=UPI000935301B|nr:TetR/AcrR family transcriptional regulator [Pseudozobellia thermophila]